MRASLLPAGLLVGLLLGPLAPAANALLPSPVPCAPANFIPGTQLVAAPAGQWLQVTFTADAPLAGTFWGEVAFRTSQMPPGLSAERAGVAAFFEDAQGGSLGVSALAFYPYGVQADLAGAASVRLTALDGACGSGAGGIDLALEPGRVYRVVVLGSTDTGSGHAAALPAGVRVLGVERGPATRLSEAGYACAAGARVQPGMVATAALLDCHTPYTAADRAYRALFVGRFPDGAHEVRWTLPGGAQTPPVVFATLAAGPPGTYVLDIPRYVTPFAHPFFTPGPSLSDHGVFGAFASVP